VKADKITLQKGAVYQRSMSRWIAKLLKSSIFRIYLVYALIFSLSVLIVVGFFYWLSISYLQDQAKDTVNAEIATLQSRYQEQGFIGLRMQLTEYITNQKPGDPSIYLLTDDGYRTLLGNLDRWPTVAFDKDGWMDFALNQRVDGQDSLFRAMARSVQIDGRLWLMVGQSMEDLSRIHEQLTKAMLSGLNDYATP